MPHPVHDGSAVKTSVHQHCETLDEWHPGAFCCCQTVSPQRTPAEINHQGGKAEKSQPVALITLSTGTLPEQR